MEHTGDRNSSTNFECIQCNYRTIRHSQYTRHLLTALHKRRCMDTIEDNASAGFACSCGNIYKYKRGLHRLKRKMRQKRSYYLYIL